MVGASGKSEKSEFMPKDCNLTDVDLAISERALSFQASAASASNETSSVFNSPKLKRYRSGEIR